MLVVAVAPKQGTAGTLGNRDDGAEKLASSDGDGGKLMRCMKILFFFWDATDDTDIVEDILRPRVDSIRGQIKKVILSGTHLTPCI